ncbi:hypothetical protein K5M49_07805, partial [Serratia marcescens]|nr:hypothetical protein [Serratia marcescens]
RPFTASLNHPLSVSYFGAVNKYLSDTLLLNHWGYYNYLRRLAPILPMFAGNNSSARRVFGRRWRWFLLRL